MNVVFDAICLGDGPATGVARAFLNGLLDYAAQWPDDTVVLAPEGADRDQLPSVRIVSAPRGALRRQWALPRLLRGLKADVLHSSVVAIPLRAPCVTIATVHDLPWLHPESGERSSWWRRFATVRAMRAATAVIAPSMFTLSAAARLLGERTKLHHIPHGTTVPANVSSPSERNGPFLVLGDDRPRKNRTRVGEAHRLAKQQFPDLPDIRFVGPPDDYVTEDEKVRLLQTCRAVVQCSLYEGFGMPVLEALAHGAPIICSDIPPHREIAEDRAFFVPARDVKAIAQALMQHVAAPHSPAHTAAPTPRRVACSWRDLHTSQALPAT